MAPPPLRAYLENLRPLPQKQFTKCSDQEKKKFYLRNKRSVLRNVRFGRRPCCSSRYLHICRVELLHVRLRHLFVRLRHMHIRLRHLHIGLRHLHIWLRHLHILLRNLHVRLRHLHVRLRSKLHIWLYMLFRGLNQLNGRRLRHLYTWLRNLDIWGLTRLLERFRRCLSVRGLGGGTGG